MGSVGELVEAASSRSERASDSDVRTMLYNYVYYVYYVHITYTYSIICCLLSALLSGGLLIAAGLPRDGG